MLEVERTYFVIDNVFDPMDTKNGMSCLMVDIIRISVMGQWIWDCDNNMKDLNLNPGVKTWKRNEILKYGLGNFE